MPLKIYRRKGSDIWHYRGTVGDAGGRRLLRRSTQTSDKGTALRIAAEVEARHWKSRLDGPESVLTFGQAATLYIKAGKQTRFVAALVAYWKDTPIRAINGGAVRQAALTLLPTQSNATRNRHVIVPTQAIINHAAESELCQRLRVKRFVTLRKEREPATWQWVTAFMSASSPHLAALACFMFLTGARISEALSLTWSDVDFEKRRALIRQTKIGNERQSHLPPALITALANVGGSREGRVFHYASRHNLKTQWETAIKRAGIKRLTPHSCRHGFATAMLQAGIDPVTVAKLGGWKDTAMLFKTYGHAMDDPTLTDRIAGDWQEPRKVRTG